MRKREEGKIRREMGGRRRRKERVVNEIKVEKNKKEERLV